MKATILRVVALGLMGASGLASATSLVGSTTDPTGVNGLVVGSTTYDVTLSTPAAFPSGPNFATSVAAGAAATALETFFAGSGAVTGLGGYLCGPGIVSPAAVFPVCQVYVPYTDTKGLVYGSNVNNDGPGWSVNPPGALAVDTDSLGLVGAGYDEWAIFTAVQSSVPEPMTFTLLGLGLVGVGFMRRRKKS
jgi:hypothetical protein